MYALVDCNNFYASCERVFRPDLKSKPIVVLSNNDGCVIARSAESKLLGIPMGAPAYQYRDLFEKNSVAVFSCNFALYGDMSNRVMSILSQYSPNQEIYSIDECFLDFSSFPKEKLNDIGLQICKQILQWTSIPVSVGFAPTKTLAKMANHIAKKFPERTNGVYVIDSDEKRIKALKWDKIDDVWGIGRRFSQRLNQMGVKTAYDFTMLGDNIVRKYMSVIGLKTLKELQGQPCLEMQQVQLKQSIAVTRTFEHPYTTFEQLRERIVSFATSCAEKLRKQKSCCSSVMVFISTNLCSENMPQYRQQVAVGMPFSTNSTIEIVKFATSILKHIYRNGYAYKKAGVIVLDVSQENPHQLSLFEERNMRHVPLMSAIDKINHEFGQSKIRLAAQDVGRVWKMRQESLSPRYTTSIDDVIRVKA